MAKSEISEWMPLYIEKFHSSRRVRNMRDFQKWWYMALLMEAWQSDPPCHLSADSEELRMIAGANQADWEKHSNLVLGCFSAVEGTNLVVNQAQLRIYNEKVASRQAKAQGGKKGAAKRWHTYSIPIAIPSEAINSPSVSVSQSSLNQMNVELQLSEFDGDLAFRDLCKVHPRAELDQTTVLAFMDRVQSDAKEYGCSDLDAYLKIHAAAEEYHRLQVAGKLRVVYGLGNWLRKGIYRQDPAMWGAEDAGRPKLVERPISLPERRRLEAQGVTDFNRPAAELRKLLDKGTESVN